ncbi:MAG: outer membrane lipoprotein carrier protein LolA [Thermoanaerobaculia bacterium]|nr:MAG: outer membrane lipoprotein carrier protein LolA [Thermoanaerobaculia bacterium]
MPRHGSRIRAVRPFPPAAPEGACSIAVKKTFRLRRFALLALLLLAPVAARGEEGGTPPDPEAEGLSPSTRLHALIDRVRFEQKRLATLSADFVQERESEFLAAPERSTGTFSYARPDRVRWEYESPKPISLVIAGEEMLTWYRDLGRAERVKVGRVSRQAFHYLNASGSLDSLMSYFSVSYTVPAGGEPYKLVLTPRYARIAKRLKSMTLWIDRQYYLPVGMRYVEPNGDSTEYRLDHLVRNEALPEDRFELRLPADVEVREVDLGGGGRANGS